MGRRCCWAVQNTREPCHCWELGVCRQALAVAHSVEGDKAAESPRLASVLLLKRDASKNGTYVPLNEAS